MQFLKTCLLVLIFAALVLTGWVCLAALAVERTALSPAYYKGLGQRTGMASFLYTAFEESVYNRLPRDLPAELREMMVRELARAFPETWFEEQYLIAAQDFLALAKGRQKNLSAVVDLREGKARYEGELFALLSRLPASRLETLGIDEGEIGPTVQRVLRAVNLPDQLLLPALLGKEGVPGKLETAASLLRKYRWSSLYAPFFLFLLFLFFYYRLAGLFPGLKWFGTAFFVAGTTFFTFLLLLQAALLSSLITPPRSFLPFSTELFAAAIRYTLARSFTAPLVFALGGLLLLIGAFILERRSGDKTGTAKMH